MIETVWTWAIGFNEEDKVWEQSKDLQELELPREVLDSVKFGEVAVTRLDLTHKSCILFLFLNKDCGDAFKYGYSMGEDIQYYGEEYWKNILKDFEGVESKQVYPDPGPQKSPSSLAKVKAEARQAQKEME
jgi:hypothetical protein